MLSAKPVSQQSDRVTETPRSAYVHIPFCRRRCYYCDFPISVVGDHPPLAGSSSSTGAYGSHSGTIAQYVEILCQEIRLASSQPQPLETIFFGGGTPSLLSVDQLSHILDALEQQFGIDSQVEVSMEIDPGTFDLEQVQGYRAAGVNRVSLGVQAFQPELLAACGRSHTVEDVEIAVRLLRQAGFENFSLDLISGLPHQTLEHWQDSLQRAIAISPTHLSCYDLTVEPITAFGRRYQPGIAPLPSDDATAQMYRLASYLLQEAGYHHYEISNYAQPGYQCRHNRVYWQNRPFYGFGMGATSYVDGNRFARPRKTREYYAWVNELAAGERSQIPVTSESSAERLLDTLMLGFRLAEGLSIEALLAQFGRATVERAWRCLQPYYSNHWIVVEAVESNLVGWDGKTLPTTGRWRLTDPEGFLFSNVILVSLFEEFESVG